MRRSTKEKREDRRAAVAPSIALADPERDLLVVDEADALLAASLDELLDDHDRTVPWIVNRIDRMDASILRRFDYSFAMREPGHGERAAERTADLASTYELGLGAIDRCLTVVARMDGRAADLLPDVLERHARLARDGQPRRRSAPRLFDPALCRSNVDLARITSAARRFAESCPGTHRAEGIALLLYGEPGTGKSAYAAYLAEELAMPLVEKRASDLVSPYVGQTETNIAAAFTEAREGLFDRYFPQTTLSDAVATQLAPRRSSSGQLRGRHATE